MKARTRNLKNATSKKTVAAALAVEKMVLVVAVLAAELKKKKAFQLKKKKDLKSLTLRKKPVLMQVKRQAKKSKAKKRV